MRIALIGATGFVGTPTLTELLNRDHHVTVLARHPEKLAARPNLTVVKADALDAAQLAAAVKGHDAVLSTYNPGWHNPDIHDEFLRGYDAQVAGVKQAGVKRFVMVGGAGSLFVAPGLQLVDTEGFPAEYKPGALAARESLNRLRKEDGLEWTFLSPPILLVPGERTGQYRVGAEAPLVNGDPQGTITLANIADPSAYGTITVADLAVALVDELETPRHIRARFTVAA